MLAAFVGGFILTGIFCLILLSNPRSKNDNPSYTVGGADVMMPLPEGFDRILVEETTESYDEYRMKQRGICVAVSDSVERPMLRFSAGWAGLLRTSVSGDTLKVVVNLDSLLDSLAKNDVHYPLIASDSKWSVTVVLPRGMKLRNVDCRWRSLMLKNFSSGSVDVAVSEGYLVVDKSRLDSITVLRKGLTELKVSDGSIGYLSCPLGKRSFEVDCCDGSGKIERMVVNGKKGNARYYGELNLSAANVGTLLWVPDSVGESAGLNLEIKGAMEISMPTK